MVKELVSIRRGVTDENRLRDSSGQYSAEYPAEEFLEAIRSVEIATTQAISDTVGCHLNTAHHRLDQLEDDGRVNRGKIGNAFVWSVE